MFSTLLHTLDFEAVLGVLQEARETYAVASLDYRCGAACTPGRASLSRRDVGRTHPTACGSRKAARSSFAGRRAAVFEARLKPP